ncbi:MAG TPA: helix-turn-helix domain-containing protein [Streptosporangiaceae bacterium]|jgi:DNA-binding HxlR family transcriptional regulator|nr:helix-turn-helix domain-containing protein [Streptosporangiaceae bacterium]
MPTTVTTATPAATGGGCPIAPVVDIVFSRWTTPILWQLHTRGRQRFNDLKELAGGITAKVLTQRLRQLERDGLVARFYFGEVPPRVEYEITPLGASLAPVFASLVTWSGANLDQVRAARTAYDKAGKPLP